MNRLLTLAVALAIALTAACATAPGPKSPVEVSRLACETPSGASYGSSVQVGRVSLTALHVVSRCPSVVPEATFGDLAILSGGTLSSCEDVKAGESVILRGFPASSPRGKFYRSPADIRPEFDTGSVVKTNVALLARDDAAGLVRIEGLTAATSSLVRKGYSGGAVVSAADGRLVGIINAKGSNDPIAYFTPVSAICRHLRKP